MDDPKSNTTTETIKEAAAEALKVAKEKTSSAVEKLFGSNDEQGSPSHVDEVDMTPEEQFTRHHVELDVEKLPSHQQKSHHPSFVEQVKEKARSAVASITTEKHEQEKQDKVVYNQNGSKEDDNASSFPETLQEAINGNTTSTPSSTTHDNNNNDDMVPIESSSTEPAPGDPFEGRARSKL